MINSYFHPNSDPACSTSIAVANIPPNSLNSDGNKDLTVMQKPARHFCYCLGAQIIFNNRLASKSTEVTTNKSFVCSKTMIFIGFRKIRL